MRAQIPKESLQTECFVPVSMSDANFDTRSPRRLIQTTSYATGRCLNRGSVQIGYAIAVAWWNARRCVMLDLVGVPIRRVRKLKIIHFISTNSTTKMERPNA